MTVGLRVSPEEEIEGLDHTEHAGIAYPDFGLSTHGTSPMPSSMVSPAAAAAGVPVREG
jgi:Amt family ammonium transporter